MSSSIQIEIEKALERERCGQKNRVVFTMAVFLVVSFGLGFGLAQLLSVPSHFSWWLGSVLWAGVAAAFAFHGLGGSPQVEIGGYWTPFALFKVLAIMTIMTWVQLVTCPHLTFLNIRSPFAIPVLNDLMMFYMSFGSDPLCEFLCGLSGRLAHSALFLSINGRRIFNPLRVLARRELVRINGLASDS